MSDDPDWIDQLYAEGNKDVPPATLDEKIRAAARQTVPRRWYRNPGRLAAMATAASLVIAVSVIYFESGLEERLPDRREGSSIGAAETAPQPIAADEEADERQLKSEAAEQPLTRQISNTPAATPAAKRIAPAPSTGRSATAAGEVRALSKNQLAEAIAAAPSDQAASAFNDVAAELTNLCGALPGTEETRKILSDESGWRVTVTMGNDVRTWRCMDGTWIETTSQEQ